RRIRNVPARSRELRVEVARDRRGRKRRRREDDRARLQATAVFAFDDVRAVAADAGDGRVQADRVGGQHLDEGLDEFAQAARQRLERTVGIAGAGMRPVERRLGPERFQQRALLLPGLDEARKQRLDRQAIDVPRVDAGQQRLGQIRLRLATEPPRHERSNRLVAIVPARGDEQLHPHADLAGPREQARLDERSPLRGNAEDRRSRERVQRAAALDVGEARQLGRHQAIADPELLAQLDAVGFLNQQRVGTAVEDEAVDRLAEDDAAGARSALEHDERDAASVQLVRRREPRDAATDDDNVRHTIERTKSSSSAMKVGEVFSDSVRRSEVENSRASRAAWTSMSNRISVWSQTNPIGTIRNLRTPLPDCSSSIWVRLGPIHGSGVRPALWNACAYFVTPARSATPRAVAATSSA